MHKVASELRRSIENDRHNPIFRELLAKYTSQVRRQIAAPKND